MAGFGDQFIGAGWSFPMGTNARGSIALSRHETEIRQAIRLILGTAPGERPMRPEFGCRIHEYVFAPADATTAGMLAFETKSALERWEFRIDDVAVDVTFDDDDPTLLWIDVRYRIHDRNEPRNLVFPFYVIPEGGED